MSIFRSQKGDTILEVLIAVTVLSLVLTSSFALANRNIQATRQASERGEAYKIAQSEMEKLKLYLSSPGSQLPDEGEYFCMSPLADSIIPLGSSADGPIDPDEDKSFTTYPIYSEAEDNGDQCRVDGLYYKILQRGTTQPNTYTAFVRWPAVTGSGVDQSSIVHKVYPDLSYDTLPPASSPVITPAPSPSPTPAPPAPSPSPSPPPAITNQGRNFTSCQPLETYACVTTGSSVYNCQNYRANYAISPASGTGYTSLFLDYADDTTCSGAPTPPVSLYKYNVNVYVNGVLNLSNYQLSPAGGNITIPLNGPVPSVSTISLEWTNNIWVSNGSNPFGYDPDLKINRIGLR